MKQTLGAVAFLLVFFATMAHGAPANPFPNVKDTSFVEPNGDRVIRVSTTIAGDVNAVWSALSTAEGWKRWAVPVAWVDFRVGGIVETSYDAKAQAGAAGNIKNMIAAYVPQRALVLRNVQTPADFKHPAEFGRTATVILIRPISAHLTEVEINGVGFKSGAAFDELYAMFRQGNAWTLEGLKASIEKGPTDWSKVNGGDKLETKE